jgi:hypothetical protein
MQVRPSNAPRTSPPSPRRRSPAPLRLRPRERPKCRSRPKPSLRIRPTSSSPNPRPTPPRKPISPARCPARTTPPPASRRAPEPGWTLRQATGSSPVALGGGPGQVVSVAAFCLGGSPWLALELDPAPEAASIRADFGFTGTRVEAEALREDGAGGAYVIELADSPLAGLLAGSDSVAALGLDGTQQGPLSLAGSTRVIRAALEDCHAF